MDKPKITFKPKTNPLLDSLPKRLKDPANYQDIKKQIWESVQTTCLHNEVWEMAQCPKCTEKMLERRRLLKKLGFKNPAQYREWDKVHTEIIRRYPLVDWHKNQFIVK